MGHRSEADDNTHRGTTAKAKRKAAKAAAEASAAVAHAERAASKAAARASAKAAKASKTAGKQADRASKKTTAAATKPARLVGKLTDPKVAKRAVTVGKIVAPALAPLLLKAAAGTRSYLDQRRANALGVAVDDVAAFRGPTGAVGARITGLGDAIRELGSRKGNDLQVTRFTDVAAARLRDLTAAVQACASMPKAKRSEVLRAVSRELDEIDADLVTHLMSR